MRARSLGQELPTLDDVLARAARASRADDFSNDGAALARAGALEYPERVPRDLSDLRAVARPSDQEYLPPTRGAGYDVPVDVPAVRRRGYLPPPGPVYAPPSLSGFGEPGRLTVSRAVSLFAEPSIVDVPPAVVVDGLVSPPSARPRLQTRSARPAGLRRGRRSASSAAWAVRG